MAEDALDRLFQQSPPTMGPSEVGERLGTTTKTVYSWLNQGLIPGYKIGSTWFVIRDELKDQLRTEALTRRDATSAEQAPSTSDSAAPASSTAENT